MARPANYRVRVDILEDGSIKNRRVERYAIFLADDVEDAAAWHLSDGKESGDTINYSYRRRVEDDGNFKRRLAELRAEREKLMAGDPFSHLVWQANQSYRLAVAAGDQKEMRACTELGLKLLERQQIANGTGGPRLDQIPSARGPGRPANEPQVTKVDSQFKARLRDMKMVPPGTPAEASDAA